MVDSPRSWVPTLFLGASLLVAACAAIIGPAPAQEKAAPDAAVAAPEPAEAELLAMGAKELAAYATLTFKMVTESGRIYTPQDIMERTELVLAGRFAEVKRVETLQL